MNDTYIADILRQNGFSYTKQRQLVFNALKNKEPLTIQEIIRITRNTINRASIYRIITLFEKLSIIQRLSRGNTQVIELTDQFNQHHHHFTCINCHRVLPISEQEDDLEKFLETLAHTYEFKPTSHQVEIQGYCSNCR